MPKNLGTARLFYKETTSVSYICHVKVQATQLENDMKYVSYSGGQPVKLVMKSIIEQEQQNRTKQITVASIHKLPTLCGEGKHL